MSNRSPQTEQMPCAIGCISERHASQTGSREMLIKGVEQIRQSEGKRVANKLSARLLADDTTMDTSEPYRGATSVPVTRIGSPLLLKTSLPRFAPCRPTLHAGRIYFSIAGRQVPSNDSTTGSRRAYRFGLVAFLNLDENGLDRSPITFAAAHCLTKH